MILFIDTSTPTCRVRFFEEGLDIQDSWEAGRELSKGLLGYLQDIMSRNQKSWQDISGIVVYQGPGSFTGLRIGITVVNTIAYTNKVPIVGTSGENWQDDGLMRLKAGEDDKIVMPFYGAEANITQPRK